MPATKKERPSRQASIPTDLMRRVEWMVQNFPELGYQSATEMTRDCIRLSLRLFEEELERHIRIADKFKRPPTFLRMDEARRRLED